MDQPTATMIAAGTAAIVSLISLWITQSNAKKFAALNYFGDENKEIRKRLKELAELLNRAETSIRRLVALSPQLDPTQIMQEATYTLAIVSDVFRATADDKVIDFPDSVVASTCAVREKITALFLQLDISYDRRQEQTALRGCFDAFAKEIVSCHTEIRKHVTPRAKV